MCLPGQQERSAHSGRPGRLLKGRAIRQRGLQRRNSRSQFSFQQEAFLWQIGLQRNRQICAGRLPETPPCASAGPIARSILRTCGKGFTAMMNDGPHGCGAPRWKSCQTCAYGSIGLSSQSTTQSG